MTPALATRVAHTIRPVLWIGVVFNALIAVLLAFPDALDMFAVLPPLASTFYRWMLVWFVLVFSATYAWMALQPRIPQAMLGLASLGKGGVFAVALACWLRDDIAGRTLAVTGIDLVFSVWFLACLRALEVVPGPAPSDLYSRRAIPPSRGAS